jgi:hypothetical protein
MTGTILVGSMVGYSGKTVFSIDDIAKLVHKLNKERAEESRPTIPCIISETILIGRSGDARYEEKVFNLEFSISPRSPKVLEKTFAAILAEYADSLGSQLKQTRVYIKFKDRIAVLKAKPKP